MAEIILDNVSKSFGTVSVIHDVSLSIKDGEFVVFLGPSGSGKTTLLRMIAGLETIDKGTLTIGGARCEHLPPGQRNVAMVFQNYALLSAYDRAAEHGLRAGKCESGHS